MKPREDMLGEPHKAWQGNGLNQEKFIVSQELRSGLQATMRLQGLFEMMFEVLSDWMQSFIADIEEFEGDGSTTPRSGGSCCRSNNCPLSHHVLCLSAVISVKHQLYCLRPMVASVKLMPK